MKEKDSHVLSTYKSIKGCGDVRFCLGSDSAKNLPIKDVDFLIICAAKTSSTFINENEALSNKINIDATCDLITQVKNKRTKILFLSSDSVFNIAQKTRNELSDPNPSSTYGKQKYAVEKFLLDGFREQAIILRLTKVLNRSSSLFMPLLSKDNSLFRGFSYKKNYLFSPITLNYCLINILKILEHNVPGIFHLSSEKIISSYSLFRELAINLQVFDENRVFFRDKSRETNESSYMGYLNMKYTTKKLSTRPEKYLSLIKNLTI